MEILFRSSNTRRSIGEQPTERATPNETLHPAEPASERAHVVAVVLVFRDPDDLEAAQAPVLSESQAHVDGREMALVVEELGEILVAVAQAHLVAEIG